MRLSILILILISLHLFAQEEESEALRAMRLSCEKHQVGLACYNYANMLLRKENPDADRYFEMGCKLHHSPSCQKEKWDLPAPPPVEQSESVIKDTDSATQE